MYDVSLYKYDSKTDTFVRDCKQGTKVCSTLQDAIDAMGFGVTHAAIVGCNGCAIYDLISKKFIKHSYVDPNFVRKFVY